ncbi:MAG: nucleotidyltransferase domain-containing protein, partial [Ignavibacteria bacterium]|nr:nucleotidyltransferase domain-containing protein [Ignavibacteria bacterium]
QTKRSDIDLLVSLKKPIGLEFVDLSYELAKLFNHKVDLVSKGAVQKRLMSEIEKDIIYV